MVWWTANESCEARSVSQGGRFVGAPFSYGSKKVFLIDPAALSMPLQSSIEEARSQYRALGAFEGMR